MIQGKLGPTVYGIETEYSVLITPTGQLPVELVGSCHSADVELGLYEQPKARGIDVLDLDLFRSGVEAQKVHISEANGMLSNGGRLYFDPSGPEYATPETTTAREAVLRSFDGDHLVFNAFRYMQEKDLLSSFQLNRRNVDHNRSSRGTHINIATSLDADPGPRAIRLFDTLAVAKGSLFGSGGLLLDKHGQTDFYHSPRLAITNRESYPNIHHGMRYLTRYPFKSDVGCNRIEIVSGDALNFAWPLRASMVVSNALIRILELRLHHHIEDLPILHDPIRAAAMVGKLGHEATLGVVTKNGTLRSEKPARILTKIAEKALGLDIELEILDDESRQVLREVIEAADIVDRDPEALGAQIESIGRRTYFKKVMSQDKSLSLASERLCRLDYLWDMVGGGVAEKMRGRSVGWDGFELGDQKPNKKRLATPPVDTRASIRGPLVKDRQTIVSSEWNNIHGFNGTNRQFIHPLQTEL